MELLNAKLNVRTLAFHGIKNNNRNGIKPLVTIRPVALMMIGEKGQKLCLHTAQGEMYLQM